MSDPVTNYRALAQSVSARLKGLRASTPEAMKAFNDLGRAATAGGALDAKTKELIALALSVAARCDPCIAFHAQALVRLGATRQELDEMLRCRVMPSMEMTRDEAGCAPDAIVFRAGDSLEWKE